MLSYENVTKVNWEMKCEHHGSPCGTRVAAVGGQGITTLGVLVNNS